MNNIFLTGASGFIGFNIAKRLLENNHKVIAPVRKESTKKIAKLYTFGNFKSLTGDFFDSQLLNRVSEKIDTILHFASIRGEGAGSVRDYQKINIDGTVALLNYAKALNIKEFIYCSSVGVFGTIPSNQPTAVEQKVYPDNYYHSSKWQAEQLVNKHHNSQMKTCILRPTITYGSGDNGFVPKLIKMVKSKKLPLSMKDVYIHLLDVNAFSELILNIINSGKLEGKTYIVADKEPVLLKDLTSLVSLVLGKNSGWINIPALVLDMAELFFKILGQKKLLTSIQLINRSWTYDIKETINDLDYQPSETLLVLNNYLKEMDFD